ncbi:MAG: tryptophan--tRNA ligase [Cyclobacteriaceae bacterium]|nr:tryptophan--tRNA ligase [Cyclobacteriaceae bacterium]
MKRILTGIQSSGRPHLGNIMGAILPAIQLSQNKDHECFFFIADLHSLTTIKDGSIRKENIIATAAAWLSFNFDTNTNFFYRQSHVSEVCELMWYLNCFMPYQRLQLAHSFKDKSSKLSDINNGLFSYPVLMAADILLYDANAVPVGKDQQQHLEITRRIATTFNHQYGEVLVVPDAMINEKVMVIPGTDGNKMSKSYGNTIDIFAPEKQLKKQINSIITDSTPLEDPKNAENDITFQLYSTIASSEDTTLLKEKYLGGNYGYGHAKKELLGLILEKFSEPRKRFDHYSSNPNELEIELKKGEEKARIEASKVLKRVRTVLGFE